jgi:hypothetical protein
MGLRDYILLVFLSFSFLCVAQNDDAYKVFLKHSSVAVHKAQKEMIKSKKTDEGGLLAKAVIMQNNAIKLYKLNSSKAACVSAVARKYAANIIKDINGTVDAFYLISDDDKLLLTNCSDDATLYNESKLAAGGPSELDKDYIGSLNNLKIDFN